MLDESLTSTTKSTAISSSSFLCMLPYIQITPANPIATAGHPHQIHYKPYCIPFVSVALTSASSLQTPHV